jgi:RHS repeat-associated protein
MKLNNEELKLKGLKNSKKYHYIYSPDGLAAIYYTYGTTTAMYYAAKDHLGSICMLIDQNRSVVDERSFDAWGRNRNPVNWTYSSVPAMLITNRGYTTHEHLTDYGIVNMNGRLYDPIAARMMNADPFIADYTSGQDFNRYSYVRNNPLRYTDPSGNFNMLQPVYSVEHRAYGYFVNNGMTKEEFSWLGYGTIEGGVQFVSNSHYTYCRNELFISRHNTPETGYQGDFLGTPVVSSGRLNIYSAFYTPGVGCIMTHPNVRSDRQLLSHERGHRIQEIDYGFMGFIFNVGVPSILSYSFFSSTFHDNAPWEISANYFSYKALGSPEWWSNKYPIY